MGRSSKAVRWRKNSGWEVEKKGQGDGLGEVAGGRNKQDGIKSRKAVSRSTPGCCGLGIRVACGEAMVPPPSGETVRESQRGSHRVKGTDSGDPAWLPILAPLFIRGPLTWGKLFRLPVPHSAKL